MLDIKRKIIFALDPHKDSIYGGVGGIGLSLEMKEQGLTASDVKDGSLAAKKGLAKTDIIVAIEGKPTRYMPIKEAIKLIDKSSSRGRIDLDVVKETTLWRKEP
jgi:C-terminal processing protease CtpA/Prc